VHPDPNAHPLTQAIRIPAKPPLRSILDATARALAANGSELAPDGKLDSDLELTSATILAETAGLIAGSAIDPANLTANFRDERELTRVGRLRAQQNRHPAESLMAAETLFDSAVEPMADWAFATFGTSAVEVARVLHHAIWRRFPPGAVAYAQSMRERLSVAHQESRLRLSRDLHDRVAHGIAAGLQRIELSESGLSDPDLIAATAVLRGTLDDVQSMALDLRQLVGDRNLGTAISDYVRTTAGVPPTISVTETGTTRPLAPVIAEEAFMIVLEAIRNTREHAASATSIRIALGWGPERLVLAITDDGQGFSHDDVATGSIGLLDMRERADSIHGQLTINAAPGQGTAVTLTIPYAEAQS
jgi:signal transduction histidine kinase